MQDARKEMATHTMQYSVISQNTNNQDRPSKTTQKLFLMIFYVYCWQIMLICIVILMLWISCLNEVCMSISG